jgi:ribosomal protein S18 acetylase RimI-like enzyme
MQIRDARPDELAEIGELRVDAYRSGGFLPAGSDYAQTLRALGADGAGQVLVAEAADGTLVGTVMLQLWPHAAEIVRGSDEAEVRALAVRPEARGGGAGKALMAAVIERAARHGVRHLVLCSQPAMAAAHRVYDDAGFTRLPERDWSPVPQMRLLAYGLWLPENS